jgi:hypothetical protein
MNTEIDIYNYPTDPEKLPAYRIAVMQAALEGKLVEFSDGDCDWEPHPCPAWNWSRFDYRIAAPEKTRGQKDEDAYLDWVKDTRAVGRRDAWFAALQYERSRQ